jgi:predicted HTH transcriptional regulator
MAGIPPGWRRETFSVPEATLREASLNAVVHKDYASGTPIQISVYPLGVKVTEFFLQRMKTKWGNCNARRAKCRRPFTHGLLR